MAWASLLSSVCPGWQGQSPGLRPELLERRNLGLSLKPSLEGGLVLLELHLENPMTLAAVPRGPFPRLLVFGNFGLLSSSQRDSMITLAQVIRNNSL